MYSTPHLAVKHKVLLAGESPLVTSLRHPMEHMKTCHMFTYTIFIDPLFFLLANFEHARTFFFSVVGFIFVS